MSVETLSVEMYHVEQKLSVDRMNVDLRIASQIFMSISFRKKEISFFRFRPSKVLLHFWVIYWCFLLSEERFFQECIFLSLSLF